MAQCPDCDSIRINLLGGIDNEGDGKCSECHGTGSGGLLDQFSAGLVGERSEYYVCHGTGQCQTCGGTGEN